MSTLTDELPLAEIEEKRIREDYVSRSVRVSLARLRAAEDLVIKVNNILPELEMRDKRIRLLFRCPIDINKENGVFEMSNSNNNNIRGISPRSVGPRGWDRVKLQVDQVKDSSPSSNPFPNVVLSVGLAKNINNNNKNKNEDLTEENGFGAYDYRSSYEELENEEGEDEYDEDDSSVVSALGSLSSGEGARLALALETVCRLDNEMEEVEETSAASSRAVNNNREEGMLVFDEIDAHVGGDAAVAVAKLLRRQGLRRQIVAVTHNPVIAAAAHRHFLVQRTQQVHFPLIHINR